MASMSDFWVVPVPHEAASGRRIVEELSILGGLAKSISYPEEPLLGRILVPFGAILLQHLPKQVREDTLREVARATYVIPTDSYDVRHHPPKSSSALYHPFLQVIEAAHGRLVDQGDLEVAVVDALTARNPFFSPYFFLPDVTRVAVGVFYSDKPGAPLRPDDLSLLHKRKSWRGFMVSVADCEALGRSIGLAAKFVSERSSSVNCEESGLQKIYELTA